MLLTQIDVASIVVTRADLLSTMLIDVASTALITGETVQHVTEVDEASTMLI